MALLNSNAQTPALIAFAACLMLAAEGLLAGQTPGEAEHAAAVESAAPDAAEGTRVSERLRHKNRAVTAQPGGPDALTETGKTDTAATQHRETDADFIKRSAAPSAGSNNTPDPEPAAPNEDGTAAEQATDAGAGEPQGAKKGNVETEWKVEKGEG